MALNKELIATTTLNIRRSILKDFKLMCLGSDIGLGKMIEKLMLKEMKERKIQRQG